MLASLPQSCGVQIQAHKLSLWGYKLTLFPGCFAFPFLPKACGALCHKQPWSPTAYREGHPFWVIHSTSAFPFPSGLREV